MERIGSGPLLLVSVAALLGGGTLDGIPGISPSGAQARELFVAPPQAGEVEGDGSASRPYRDLRAAAARAAELSASSGGEPIRLRLRPGDYHLDPLPITEPTCGNCEDPATPVEATLGLRIAGNGVWIVGADDHRSVIHTGAGYGLLFQDCQECALQGVVVTGGIRDTSSKATDAAVVVQRSSVLIRDNWIRDNIGDPEIIAKGVVGIMGITGREGSRIRIVSNRITRNSWDGIALYRDAEAEIVGNEIDGVDLALGRSAGGGRGVGIGLTWNSRAQVRGNRVTHYWKGIGIFVDAQATVEENVVEEIATWGLSLWDAGRGRPHGSFRHNVVDSTGACGAAIVRGSPDPPPAGDLIDNLFSRTGQNPKYDSGEPYCYQTAVALHALPEEGVPAAGGEENRFQIRGNLFLDNREPGGRPGSGDVEPDAIRERIRLLCARLARWEPIRESRFFGRAGELGATLGSAPPGGAGDDRGWDRDGSAPESPGGGERSGEPRR